MRPNNGCRFPILLMGIAVFLIGCSSDKQWKAPNLAFWKSNPFRSSPGPAPEAIGSPVKPSTIAANSGASSPAGNRAPSGGTAPAWVSPGTPAYTASTAGVPGANAYGTNPSVTGTAPTSSVPSTTVPVPPYNPSAPYASTGAPPYGASGTQPSGYANPNPPAYTAANPYPSSPSQGNNTNTYPSTNSASQVYPSYPSSSSSPYGSGGAGATSPYDSTPSSTNPYRSDAGGTAPNYPSSYPSTSSGATPSSSTGGGNDAAPYNPGAYAPGSSRTDSGGTGSAPPSEQSPTSKEGYSIPRDRYSLSAAGRYGTSSGGAESDGARYAPIGGGYTVVPESRQVLPASATEPPPYRPGSTSEYVPRGKSISTAPGESGSGTSPAANNTPYDYSQPTGSYYR